jgi:hypothetical protein
MGSVGFGSAAERWCTSRSTGQAQRSGGSPVRRVSTPPIILAPYDHPRRDNTESGRGRLDDLEDPTGTRHGRADRVDWVSFIVVRCYGRPFPRHDGYERKIESMTHEVVIPIAQP